MKIVLSFILMIGCTVAGNLFLKAAASTAASDAAFLDRVLSLHTILGGACFVAAAIVYMQILTWLPLNVAQSFAAAQFIAIILAARLFLFEPIASIQWAGIMLIAIGIGIIGWSR